MPLPAGKLFGFLPAMCGKLENSSISLAFFRRLRGGPCASLTQRQYCPQLLMCGKRALILEHHTGIARIRRRKVTSSWLIKILPEVTVSSPAIMRIVVVFPQPEAEDVKTPALNAEVDCIYPRPPIAITLGGHPRSSTILFDPMSLFMLQVPFQGLLKPLCPRSPHHCVHRLKFIP